MFKKIAITCLAATALATSLIAQADTKPVLNVYTYDSFSADWGPGPAIKKGFEEFCGCTVNYVAFQGVGILQNRLMLEGAKTNKADVVLGLDQNDLSTFAGKGFFVKPSVPLPALSKNVPWHDASGLYTPYDYSQFAFIYNSEKLKNPPTSFKAFLADKNIRVIYQDPRTSAVGQGLLIWVNTLFPKNTAAAWKELASHTVTVGKGWTATYGAFLKGESDVALSYVTSPIYHILYDKTHKYKAMVFKEGLPYQFELAAVTASSQHPKLASEFVAYLLSKKVQTILVKTNIMFPVVDGVDLPVLKEITPVKGLPSPSPLPTEATLKQWTQVWVNALSE